MSKTIDLKQVHLDLHLRITSHCSPARAALLEPIVKKIVDSKAPASTSLGRHGGFEGGLAHHTLQVMKTGLAFGEALCKTGVVKAEDVCPEEIVTATLIHDLNKAEDLEGRPFYVPNILANGQRSDKKPWKTNEEYRPLASAALSVGPAAVALEHPSIQFPSGLTSLSLAERISPGLVATLSHAEKQAIVWHGGIYEKGNGDGFRNSETLIWLITHAADFAMAINGD